MALQSRAGAQRYAKAWGAARALSRAAAKLRHVYSVTAELWRHPGPGGWHFLTLPTEVADEVRARSVAKSFGSVRVRATVGETTWETSLFTDTKSSSYLLPVKADVRRRAGIDPGDAVTLLISLVNPAA